MSLKRKISWKKILQTVITIVVVVACGTAILSASQVHQKRKIYGIKITIKNEQYGFIDKKEIKKLLYGDSINLAAENLQTLNSGKIEEKIKSIPWVANAQVYVDNARTVHVQITQRVPVARLFDQAGNSYYLDNTLNTMPLSNRYSHYTTVVTNVPVMTNDSLDKILKAQIVALVKYIDRDSFWNAQVSQIMVTDSLEFELMPVLGNHKIVFGDTTRMKDKFENLFAFYKKILNRVGWDKYEVLDLRYDKQVVASPALPWKVPVDKASANMSWVKSIIGNDTAALLQPDMGPVTATNTIVAPVAASATAVETKPKPAVQQPKPDVKPAAVNNVKPKEKKIEQVAKAIVKKPAAKPVQKTEVKKETNEKEQTQPKYIYKGE